MMAYISGKACAIAGLRTFVQTGFRSDKHKIIFGFHFYSIFQFFSVRSFISRKVGHDKTGQDGRTDGRYVGLMCKAASW